MASNYEPGDKVLIDATVVTAYEVHGMASVTIKREHERRCLPFDVIRPDCMDELVALLKEVFAAKGLKALPLMGGGDG